MRDHAADLYRLTPGAETDATVMLVVLDGFVDAGTVGRQTAEALFDAFEARELAAFDIDRLLDYRSRRPVMTFVENAYTAYTPPQLALYEMRDSEGTPFLLLYGLEPDREWEAFAEAVRLLIERFGITLTVGVHGIPMAVPHTRPATVTAHATRADLVADHTPWVSRVTVPASAAALLEYRLGEAGHDVVGYAVHVPSYLAQSEYPRAAIAALDYVSGATGLALPGDRLEDSARQTDTEIDQQVSASEEVQRVVANLERQYDEFMSAREDGTGDTLFGGDLSDLPTADELGEELERFLAERERGTEG
ncbi:proteasome assembly chaperone family protein [Streptomonospora nanhaiensis]|uniref:Putative ATP-grasp superfamily ATP-dependent carboligase n=1 Tax=Streptomonospora nanhaiensis TaxID=1323731 RepID=A0A853BSM1_9ACTN|nr:PAC2 family protein [Streptomonospora nanhaiensis]MBX9391237.1 PAC2 family protein [Streptomonospora nanhaiensis]NYI98769.1 putative ATP-grasp superfamily ATP-dependent carboligase [Streptomonospora nanhaiensis]